MSRRDFVGAAAALATLPAGAKVQGAPAVLRIGLDAGEFRWARQMPTAVS